eukprot:scaffold1068_cov167-Amphora_coffeaeformis.AAC.26
MLLLKCGRLVLVILFLADYTVVKRQRVVRGRLDTRSNALRSSSKFEPDTSSYVSSGPPSTTTVIHNDTASVQNHDDADNVQFVFVVGIEGTGHHLLRKFVKESPSVARQDVLGMRNDTYNLQSLLYPQGLWDAVCNTHRDINVSLLYRRLVDQLRLVRQRAQGDQAQTIMLNVERNMISYPTDMGECRHMHYADLDALYTACDEAKVLCGHVYLYRDPYDVIRSTATTRKFNPTILSATKLYYSMLNIIYAQFAAHPDRTLACWGLYDPHNEPWSSVQTLFGWTNNSDDHYNATDFEQVFRRFYRPHEPLSMENRTAVVPPKLEVYMESMVRAHTRTLELCQRLVSERNR